MRRRKQIRETLDKALYRAHCITRVFFDGRAFVIEADEFFPVIVITKFNHMIGMQSEPEAQEGFGNQILILAV